MQTKRFAKSLDIVKERKKDLRNTAQSTFSIFTCLQYHKIAKQDHHHLAVYSDVKRMIVPNRLKRVVFEMVDWVKFTIHFRREQIQFGLNWERRGTPTKQCQKISQAVNLIYMLHSFHAIFVAYLQSFWEDVLSPTPPHLKFISWIPFYDESWYLYSKVKNKVFRVEIQLARQKAIKQRISSLPFSHLCLDSQENMGRFIGRGGGDDAHYITFLCIFSYGGRK